MKKEKAWVWFKGGAKGGFWMGGFIGSKSSDIGIIIERPDFINCRVPEWRVSFTEPKDEYIGPKIPEKTTWKY